MKKELVLGINKSLAGYEWLFRNQIDDDHNQSYVLQKTSDLLLKILSTRGVDVSNIKDFLSPTLKNDLPNPSLIKDMDKAALLIAKGILEKKNITILGDYDVDGATSTAVLFKYSNMQQIVTTHSLKTKNGHYLDAWPVSR